MTTAPATTTATIPPVPDLQMLALTSIKEHPDNPRVAVGDVTDLAASIAQVGILEPLVVAPAHEHIAPRAMGKASWLLIAGHRRLAAAKKAKLARVPALVRADLTSRRAQVEAMLVENLQRVDLTPVEEGDAYQLLLDIDGLTQKQLAAQVGQPVTRIRERLKLAKAPGPVREALQTHQVSISEALAIATFDGAPDEQKKLLKSVGTRNWHTDLESAQRRAKERADLAAALKACPAGTSVIDGKPAGARDLTSLKIVPYSYNKTTLEEAKEAVAAHGDCPGFAVWKPSYSYSVNGVVFGCTQPNLHAAPAGAEEGEDEAPTAEQVAAAERRAELAALHADGHRVRLAFLREVLLDPARALPLAEHALTGILTEATRILSESKTKTLAALLNLPDLAEMSDKEAQEAITLALADLNLAQRLALAGILDASYPLCSIQQHPRHTDAPAVDVLNVAGYQWSDFERDTIRVSVWDSKARRHAFFDVDGVPDLEDDDAPDDDEDGA